MTKAQSLERTYCTPATGKAKPVDRDNRNYPCLFLHSLRMCVCVWCKLWCNDVCVFPHSSDMLEDEEDDTIHTGNAIMTFYAALIDLLGRCAPEMHVRHKTSASYWWWWWGGL